MTTELELQHFAVLDLSYSHTATAIAITCATNNPCHLTCYYTEKEPLRHATSRVVRGLALPWGAYFCFVAWQTIEQIEPGDTLIHTFEIPAWSYCQTKWLCFRGTVAGAPSPSASALFKHHHPGIYPYELTLQVSHNNDDLWLRGAPGPAIMICPLSCPPYLVAGEGSRLTKYGCAVRFRNVTIPKGAVITEAYLIFNAVVDLATTTCNTRIWAENADNPPDFSGEDWISAFARRDNQTTAIVDFDDIVAWTENTEYSSPELKTVIQEIVDRDGWDSGNALVLFWDDTKDMRSETATRAVHSFNEDNERATKLYVRFSA